MTLPAEAVTEVEDDEDDTSDDDEEEEADGP